MARRVVSLTLLLVACGDDVVVSEVALAEVCGTQGPHRLLALDPATDEQILPNHGVTRIGDRLFYLASARAGESGPPGAVPIQSDPTAYATGPCGEEPVVVARDVTRVFASDRWPGVVLGCHGSDGDLVILDPRGETPPRSIAAGACRATWTVHGLVSLTVTGLEANEPGLCCTGTARFFPLSDEVPAGPIAPILLHSGIALGYDLRIMAEVAGDAVFTLDTNGDLARISLPDGVVTIEQTEVLHFDVSQDGRYMVWQAGDRRYYSLAPEGEILLRDRAAGGEQVIGHGFLGHSPPAIHEPFVEVPPHERVLLLPSLTSLEIPGPLRSAIETNDGRWLVKAGSPGPWLLVDLATGDETLLTARSDSGWPTADFLDLFHDDGDVSEPWRYYYDGRPPEQLARRMGAYIPLADGRLAMVVDIDNRWFGDLVLVERATLDERRIASRVSGMAAGWRDVFEPDIVAYAVSDGARSGVWIARLAPE